MIKNPTVYLYFLHLFFSKTSSLKKNVILLVHEDTQVNHIIIQHHMMQIKM
jgi:hypothetical protein